MKIIEKFKTKKQEQPITPAVIVKPYNGMGCPVNWMDRVTVKLRDGQVIENTLAFEVDWSWDRVGFMAKERAGDVVEFVLHS
ncbi:hypothetical protein phiOC_p295 [Ochrobactrum phage vB_OspM_OC]|nr:hypothetical protein phiOC_p295 [Ochrobactrum phage vB_OspM_OC]